MSILPFLVLITLGDSPIFESEYIAPPSPTQVHAPGIVETPQGDLIVSWYSESEGHETDAAIWGARRNHGEAAWSAPFVMANRREFPDCNTCMWIDPQQRLWLFWPTIIGNSWESSLMNFRVSVQYNAGSIPKWSREGLILLKPADFAEEGLRLLGDRKIKPPRGAIVGPDGQRAKLSDPLYQRLGWAPRCKPISLPSERILLPLYSDTFAISIMAISDDQGENWYPSKPLLGFGNIQPTLFRRRDGMLVAYMRAVSAPTKIRSSESTDEGLTWGPVTATSLPNPGSGIDGVTLANGHWLLVYNDSESDRTTLAVSISEDEGQTWSHTRHLESQPAGRFHYPAAIQATDHSIHVIYPCFLPPQPGSPESINANGKPAQFVTFANKHVRFNEEWVRSKE